MRSIALLLLGALWLHPGIATAQKPPTAAPPQGTALQEAERGQVVAKPARSGGYFQYLPRRDPVGVLVLIHGQPAGKDIADIPGLARRFAERWAPFAEDHGLIAVSPVFDEENFDSVTGKNGGGGYRFLFGRQVAADAYVEAIVARYKEAIPGWDGRFVLYGHSAGGQFASRYAVKHPDRLRALIISAAGSYAMPNAEADWPNGMGPLSRTLKWNGTVEPQAVAIRPAPKGWINAATTFPTTVVVGANDTEPQTGRDGHASPLRTERAAQWVEAMDRLARRQKKAGLVQLVVVPGIGHDSAGLTPAAQKALAAALAGP